MLLGLATVGAAVVLLMPCAISFAWKVGAIDVPRDYRRMHSKSTPRIGGMAIVLSLLFGCAVMGVDSVSGIVLSGGFFVFLIGLVDDVYPLSPWVKFTGQIAAAIWVALGTTDFGIIATFIAVLWILMLTNAHNFIDGLDGLFGGTAVAESLALSTLLWLGNAQNQAGCVLLLGGACFGFRMFNRTPAKVFAGDCGSGSVGFLLGAFSLPLFSTPTVERMAALLLLFAYPITDLCCAVLRRVLRGKSPFCADRGHLHHRICDAGVGKAECVSLLLSITVGLCTLGVLIGAFELYAEASIASFLLAALLVFIRHRIAVNV